MRLAFAEVLFRQFTQQMPHGDVAFLNPGGTLRRYGDGNINLFSKNAAILSA